MKPEFQFFEEIIISAIVLAAIFASILHWLY
jgi:hypothetical protein